MFVVVFEVQPRQERFEQYLDFARLLRPELEQIEGFIDNERFASSRHPGRILSLSSWRDEKALIRWRTHARHHMVQEQGRAIVFSNYRLRVGEVTHDSVVPGATPIKQRFDATEGGAAKCLLLLEHGAGWRPDSPDGASGLVEYEGFTGITRSERRIILSGWRDDRDAAWRPAGLDTSPDVRLRRVRVIRAYGMFDRLEAPQYYPLVEPAAELIIW